MCPRQVLCKGEVLSPHPNMPTVHPQHLETLMKSQAEPEGSITIRTDQPPSQCLSPSCPNQAALVPPGSPNHERETSKTHYVYLTTLVSSAQVMGGFMLLVSFR